MAHVLPGRIANVTWDNGWLLCSNEAGDLAALRASDGELVWRVSLGLARAAACAWPGPGLRGAGRRAPALDRPRNRAAGMVTDAAGPHHRGQGRRRSADCRHNRQRGVQPGPDESGRQRWRWRVGGDVAGAGRERRPAYLLRRARQHSARRGRRSGNLRWITELPARPVGGPQVLAGRVVVPLSTTVGIFDPQTGKSRGPDRRGGEMASPRISAPTAEPLRRGWWRSHSTAAMQGFGWRYEQPPAPFQALPGQAVVPE